MAGLHNLPHFFHYIFFALISVNSPTWDVAVWLLYCSKMCFYCKISNAGLTMKVCENVQVFTKSKSMSLLIIVNLFDYSLFLLDKVF